MESSVVGSDEGLLLEVGVFVVIVSVVIDGVVVFALISSLM